MIPEMTMIQGIGKNFFIMDNLGAKKPLTFNQMKTLSKQAEEFNQPINGYVLLETSRQKETDCQAKIYYPDYEENLFSASALCSVGHYLASHLIDQPQFVIETNFANLKVRQLPEEAYYQVEIAPVRIGMNESFQKIEPKDILLNQPCVKDEVELTYSFVSILKPHLIVFVPTDWLENKSKLEEIIEEFNQRYDLKGHHIAVSFVAEISETNISIQTYEWTHGWVLGSGKSAAAASLAYTLRFSQPFYQKITVNYPTVSLTTVVHQDQDDNYWLELIAPATLFK